MTLPRPLRLGCILLALTAPLTANVRQAPAETLPAGRVLSDGEPVSFEREVMAVLSKAGCNLGTCHGNKNGKGGFFLSLRGQDLNADFESLIRDQLGRRINSISPDDSLLVRKPAVQVSHGGGRRFRTGSLEFQLLRDWIAEGGSRETNAPSVERLEVNPAEKTVLEPIDTVQISVRAYFSDGSDTDVTRLAVFETSNTKAEVNPLGVVQALSPGEVTVLVRYLDKQVPVRLAFVPQRKGFVWNNPTASNYIDEHVFGKLRQLRINPSELCTDHVFLRRAYLDLLGILPTASEARVFVLDEDELKRSRLVDELLHRPEFADNWALKWSDLLRNEEKVLDRKGSQHFHEWIRCSLAENKPVDQFVHEIVAARGSTYTNPAANFYRAVRDPISRAESMAQVFLGTRVQCAKCHNHPFDRWTQDDYYSWAALFARIDYKILENNRRDRNDGHEFDGEQIVFMAAKGEVSDPRTGNAAPPRFLGDNGHQVGRNSDRLARLAEWITSPENERFAQAQANRIWFHLMGRGIVEPIDDFRATNPPSHPRLLNALAVDFVNSGFDLRHLIRTIMGSRTYQLSSFPNESNQNDESNFSHALVQRLSAEQLADAVDQVLGTTPNYDGYPEGMRAGQLPGVYGGRSGRGRLQAGDDFLSLFGKPPRLITCECERTTTTTMSQAFQLISGERINGLLTEPENRLGKLRRSKLSDEAIVDKLYWTALTRGPSKTELTSACEYLAAGQSRREALEDIAWALLNSKEFLLRH